MLRIALQLRTFAKSAKAPNLKNKTSQSNSKVPVFELNEKDVKSQVRTTSNKAKVNVKKHNPNWIPLITCKRPEFNLYKHQFKASNAKFDDIPLASDGWKHYKSKNDFFIIHPAQAEFNSTYHEAEYLQPFEDLNLDKTLLENLKNQLNVTKTSYVQQKAIPMILSGVHTLIAAETGCGKTIAYLVPIIMEILKQKQSKPQSSPDKEQLNAPRAIILTPGRELAIQIGEVIKNLTQNLDIASNVVIGGTTKRRLMQPMFEPIDILVGSIGATSKLITNQIYRLNRVRHVVLDEADTMFDNTFSEKLEYLMKKFGLSQNLQNRADRPGSQLIMASATLPENTYDLLTMFVDPETMQEVVSPNLHQLLPQIQQKFIRIRKSHRPLELLQIVKAEVEKSRPVIIFGNKSVTSDYISIFLNDNGVNCVALNGDMLHKIRVGQFAKFQSGEVNVLSTTDVASRGLDTTRACHVINFDFPNYIPDYLHRIGRIGRIGSDRNGMVTNFVANISDVNIVRKIEQISRTGGTFQNVNNNFTRKKRKEAEKLPTEDMTF